VPLWSAGVLSQQRVPGLPQATGLRTAAATAAAAGTGAIRLGGGEAAPAQWREADAPASAPAYRRCANPGTAAACNWLLPAGEAGATLCRCCRLTRTLPDLGSANGALWCSRIELAKRRLVSSLVGMNLPLRSKVDEDPEHGLVFDLVQAAPGAPPLGTGHADGVITLNAQEADDAGREASRKALAEP
jgi:hypothetical protein